MSNHPYPTDKCTFELLSAYLDGEVTPHQRQEVQDLLDNDPEIQLLYRRLLNLRQEINNLPIPQPEYTPRQISQGVFAKIDQQRKQRQRFLLGGGALVVATVATISGLLGGNRQWWQMAQDSPSDDGNLVIALNEPLIDLPVVEESLNISLDQPLLDLN
ncbi:MAG: zf-HC2 domain-containing protein [Cyanobacterium sp. T60_A2020_053]|nr:zf-HC2 domain-containing protein [Cyanobacterium sp. T60_A2020_053]